MLTIIGGSHFAGESCNARDQYAKDAKTLPLAQVQKTEERPPKQARQKLEDIVFIEVDARWVHHPHVDALVITARIANGTVHRLMVDDGSVTDILYLNVYKRMGLAESDLNPTTSPLYGFTRDNVVPKGMTKLTMTMGKHPRTSTVVANFLYSRLLISHQWDNWETTTEGFESNYLDLPPNREVPNCQGNRRGTRQPVRLKRMPQ